MSQAQRISGVTIVLLVAGYFWLVSNVNNNEAPVTPPSFVPAILGAIKDLQQDIAALRREIAARDRQPPAAPQVPVTAYVATVSPPAQDQPPVHKHLQPQPLTIDAALENKLLNIVRTPPAQNDLPAIVELLDDIVMCHTTVGLTKRFMYIPKSDWYMVAYMCSGYGWDTREEALYAHRADVDGIVVEFGANYGYFAQLFGARLRGPLYIGIEGNPGTFAMLERGMMTRGLTGKARLKNFLIVEDTGNGTAAVSHGRMCAARSAANAFLIFEEWEAEACKAIGAVKPMPAATAASFITEPLHKYSLIKIDMDSAEHLAWFSLKYLMERRHELFPYVVIELNAARSFRYNAVEVVEGMKKLYESGGKGQVFLLALTGVCDEPIVNVSKAIAERGQGDFTVCMCSPSC